ncbi:MAG: hypothetical protein JNJ61_27110 [Anaerolineae bacterium]|nr:hypothetical protein [Anaerolineae bacterium]
MTFQFTPIPDTHKPGVPYFEDARADYAPFYSTTKAPEAVQAEIVAEAAKLGGYAVYFVQGMFQDGKLKRHGYEARFMLNGAPGMFRVAGLPMRSEDPRKREKVLAQALCIVREWVRSMVTTKVFMPGTEPLAQYLLVDPRNSSHTVTDYILNAGKLPQLNAPSGVTVDATFEEV